MNEETDEYCTMYNCKQPSPMTMIRKDIKKFTEEQLATHLIHGFIRDHEYYLEISVVRDLFKLIHTFYYLDYFKHGWVIGDVTCMSLREAKSLKVGDKLDHRDGFDGKFKAAEVKEVGELGVKIHNEVYGWRRSLDVWSDPETELHRFAKYEAV